MHKKDSNTAMQDLKTIAKKMITDREWSQFHSPKNLSMYIAIEAAELMEKFVWLSSEQSFEELNKNRQEIEDEMADVFICLVHFCNAANIDMASAFIKKLESVKAKYPIEKAKGKHEKYNKL
jgi:dCTP diphosphatase